MKKLHSILALFTFCFIFSFSGWGQTVTSFILVNADIDAGAGPDYDDADMKILSNNDIIYLSSYNHQLTIRATATGTFDKIIFELKNLNTGLVEHTKPEGAAPYALNGDINGGNYKPMNFSAGDYQLTATPKNNGVPGTALVMNLSISFGNDVDGQVDDITGDNHSVFLINPNNFESKSLTRGTAQLRLGNSSHRITARHGRGMVFNDSKGMFFQVTDSALNPSLFERVMVISSQGVGINIDEYKDIDAELTVNGKIHAKEVLVDLNIPAPDYVFAKDYPFPDLSEWESHIKTYSHLPGIPSAKEMENKGVDLVIMQMKLLQKIEELTLIIIDQEKRLEELEDK